MKHYILKIITLVATVLFANAVYSQYVTGEFMRVAAKKIEVDGKLCYSVRKGYSRKGTAKWEPFCGKLYGDYDDGIERVLFVVDYDPKADVICVLRHLGRESNHILEPIYLMVREDRIQMNDSYCCQVGFFNGREGTRYEPFCGVFKSEKDSIITLKEGYSYLLMVDRFTPEAQTIKVIDIIKCQKGSIDSVFTNSKKDYMRVAEKKIEVDGKLCYSVQKGYIRQDTTKWEPFCGEFKIGRYRACLDSVNYYKFPKIFYVEEYDLSADTIDVISQISRSDLRPEVGCHTWEMKRRASKTKSSRLK